MRAGLGSSRARRLLAAAAALLGTVTAMGAASLASAPVAGASVPCVGSVRRERNDRGRAHLRAHRVGGVDLRRRRAPQRLDTDAHNSRSVLGAQLQGRERRDDQPRLEQLCRRLRRAAGVCIVAQRPGDNGQR